LLHVADVEAFFDAVHFGLKGQDALFQHDLVGVGGDDMGFERRKAFAGQCMKLVNLAPQLGYFRHVRLHCLDIFEYQLVADVAFRFLGHKANIA
jgi:hypothetical protein